MQRIPVDAGAGWVAEAVGAPAQERGPVRPSRIALGELAGARERELARLPGA